MSLKIYLLRFLIIVNYYKYFMSSYRSISTLDKEHSLIILFNDYLLLEEKIILKNRKSID